MTVSGLHVAAVQTATIFLAQPEGADPGGRGEGFGKSTPVGLLLMILLLIAVGFLVRSMTKHLKRAQANLNTDEQTDAGDDSDEQAESGEDDHAERRRVEASPADEGPT